MRELRLPSRPESVVAAAEEAEALATDLGWADADVTRLVLGVSEAVGNAVEHGPGGEVLVGFDTEYAETLRVWVTDEGDGPLPSAVDSASLPDASALGGRGLFILRSVCDRLGVRDGTLRLEFRARAPA